MKPFPVLLFKFLSCTEAVFIQYGFRPVNNNIDLTTVPNSPWSKNIPGVQAKPTQKILPPPDNSKLIGIMVA